MACFLACFGGAKERKLRKKRGRKTSPNNNRVNRVCQTLQTSPSPQKAAIEVAADVPAAEIREKLEEQVSPKIHKKKVTFDLNLKTYEHIAVDQVLNDSIEFKLESIEKLKEESREETKLKCSPEPNYRYQNCESSDDEYIDDDDDDGDDEDGIDDEEYEDLDIEDEVAIIANEEESYESYFSIPINKEKQQQEQSSQDDEAVDSPVPTTKTSSRDRSRYVHNVLNPVENFSQWKEVKTRGLPVKNQNKENISSNLECTKAKPIEEAKTPKKQEVSVDTSLSTWLVSSETSLKSNSNWSNSPVSREEQPILGALTIDDLKHASATSSPRKSPCRNMDDVPIVGSVGSYWNSMNEDSFEVKGIPNSTSKYGEDKKVNWHSSPFEERLERALSKGIAS